MNDAEAKHETVTETKPSPMPEIHSAPLSDLGEIAKRWQIERALLITGPSKRYSDLALTALAGVSVTIFDGAQRHVPRTAVVLAEAALQRSQAQLVVSLGGGSTTGLAKALRLTHDFKFIAVPTTYSGSEQTNLYGITEDATKRTGKDDRVRPDAVLYDVTLTHEMPLTLSVTSLFNALAHPLSVWQERTAKGENPVHTADFESLLEPVLTLFSTIETLLRWPNQHAARTAALGAAGRAACALQYGGVGLQHRLAHALGGRFNLEHSALHALLLPHTVAQLRSQCPELLAVVSERLGIADLEAHLFDFLQRAKAATGLRSFDVPFTELERFSSEQANGEASTAEFVRAAYQARRPSRYTRRVNFGLREPVSLRGPELADCRRVVLALHGRGSNADSILRRCFEIHGGLEDVTVVAPQAPNNSWLSQRHTAKRSEHGAELSQVLAEVFSLLEQIRQRTQAPIVLLGFSQGACLALEVAARSEQPFAAVIALSGAAIGGAAEGPDFPAWLHGTPVVLGASEADPWLEAADLQDTRERLQAAGAKLQFELVPGGEHAFHARHRLLARALLAADPAPAPLSGFGNAQHVEGMPGALPMDRNSPRDPAYGLYAEQLSVTGFVSQRAQHQRAWLYRVRPSSQHGQFQHFSHPRFNIAFSSEPPEPDLASCGPLPLPTEACDFVDGISTLGGAGSPALRRGYAVHMYACNRNMEDRSFCNADGELLILPELGALTLLTEFGVLDVSPGSFALIPRGVRFSVLLQGSAARGYMAEVYGRSFTLPERGPAGANGLTDARHFEAPQPWFEDRLVSGYRVVHKLGGALYQAEQDYSPYDAVAWHGNCPPYRYDLSRFSPIGNTRFDHGDPSLYTVLSAPLDEQGAHSLDLVVFPPRWDTTEDTFRVPYFHRNVTTEINGIIHEHAGAAPFLPGCCFVTPSFTPHGIVAAAATRERLRRGAASDHPHRSSASALWFQFETTLPFSFNPWVKQASNWRPDWSSMWGAYRTHFRPER